MKNVISKSISSKFKTYILDTGLLSAMLDLTSDIIVHPNRLFTKYNGAFIENFVASELIRSGFDPLYYWTSPGQEEVDFIVNINDTIVPLEVKSGLSKDIKSLRSYADKYKSNIICRISPRNFEKRNNFVNLPLYSVFAIKNVLANIRSKTLSIQPLKQLLSCFYPAISHCWINFRQFTKFTGQWEIVQ